MAAKTVKLIISPIIQNSGKKNEKYGPEQKSYYWLFRKPYLKEKTDKKSDNQMLKIFSKNPQNGGIQTKSVKYTCFR